MKYETHYVRSWMQAMQAYMQLAQSFVGFQMAHKIWLPTLNNFPASGNFYWISLSGKHDRPV
jgi:hypothetical protein